MSRHPLQASAHWQGDERLLELFLLWLWSSFLPVEHSLFRLLVLAPHSQWLLCCHPSLVEPYRAGGYLRGKALPTHLEPHAGSDPVPAPAQAEAHLIRFAEIPGLLGDVHSWFFPSLTASAVVIGISFWTLKYLSAQHASDWPWRWFLLQAPHLKQRLLEEIRYYFHSSHGVFGFAGVALVLYLPKEPCSPQDHHAHQGSTAEMMMVGPSPVFHAVAWKSAFCLCQMKVLLAEAPLAVTVRERSLPHLQQYLVMHGHQLMALISCVWHLHLLVV